MKSAIHKAGILVEAIPYIHTFRRKVFVIKYGGSILSHPVIRKHILEDIVFLSYVGIRIILVHGGGPNITSRLKKNGIKTEFHNGIRVTDKATLKIVSQELGKLNKKIVAEIKKLGGDVTGLKGEDNIIRVKKKKSTRKLGFVGTIKNIKKRTIEQHLTRGAITVVSPMGVSIDKQPHNVNADEVASAISVSLKARKLILLTNVQGVMRSTGNSKSLISTIKMRAINGLIKRNVIQGGMIPKVTACAEALRGGIRKAHIIDAHLRHALLLEMFTERGIGTQILK